MWLYKGYTMQHCATTFITTILTKCNNRLYFMFIERAEQIYSQMFVQSMTEFYQDLMLLSIQLSHHCVLLLGQNRLLFLSLNQC